MIEGIDVSNYQSNYGTHLNWYVVPSTTAKFAYIKAGSCNATDGVCWTDNSFPYNSVEAIKYLSAVGYYWYMRPTKDPLVQARYFADLLSKVSYNLPPACDIELAGTMDAVRKFCSEVWTITGKKVMVYTNPNTWLYLLTGDKSWAKACYLWQAQWGASSPSLLAPWNTWDVWQYNVLKDAQKYGVPPPPNGTANIDHDRIKDYLFPTTPPQPTMTVDQFVVDVVYPSMVKDHGYTGPAPKV